MVLCSDSGAKTRKLKKMPADRDLESKKIKISINYRNYPMISRVSRFIRLKLCVAFSAVNSLHNLGQI